jgi:hypothetical protein
MAKYALLLILAMAPLWSRAGVIDEGDAIYLQTSLWSVHFRPAEDHSNNQRLIGVELNKASGWVFGFGSFRNSFDQPSQYLYVGGNWTIPKTRELAYFKLTGGLLHGYKGEHQGAIPFNNSGIAPAILPSFGVKYKRFQSELIVFGTAGMMLTAGVNFPIGARD